MSYKESVTTWIDAVKAGDQIAAQKLWERYFDQLVRLARRKLAGSARRVADEEDVVLIAFDGFCRAAQRNRFPQLQDRHDLWRLLMTITARKAASQIEHLHRDKRGGGKVRDEAAIPPGQTGGRNVGIEGVIGDVPTPEFAVTAAEEFQRLLDRLDDSVLRQVALWKMEGYGNDEIAEKLDCSRRTVERKLMLIRAKWAEEVGIDD